MAQNTIKVFGRVKPISSNKHKPEYHIYRADDTDDDILLLNKSSGDVQLSRQDTFRFRFEKVFDQCVSQEDVYSIVAKPVVERQVSLLEDASGKLHVRNLSIHRVCSEDEALHLLFVGDTNRMTVQTKMNPRSSRSHCVFTIYLTAAVQHSKLNLVDLAGSERVYKCQLGGQLLLEARHINLSLHFLEQVILALGESNRSHIPYRNSLLTTVLRDSVGGNCITVMETVSTCRFAQRVALVTNDMRVNEQLDPQQEIAMLRAEVQQLRAQLTKCNVSQELSSEDVIECRKVVDMFLQKEEDADLSEIQGEKKMRLCLSLLKEAVMQQVNTTQHKQETELYVEQLKLRDAHISILYYTRRHERFAQFMAQPGNRQQLDECRVLLNNKYQEAKNVAADIKQRQANIRNLHNMLKKFAEHHLNVSKNNTLILEIENKIRSEQKYYKKNLEELKYLKLETDQLKCELHKIKKNLLLKFRKQWEIPDDFNAIKFDQNLPNKRNYNSETFGFSEILSTPSSNGTNSRNTGIYTENAVDCELMDVNNKLNEQDFSNNFKLQEVCPFYGNENEISPKNKCNFALRENESDTMTGVDEVYSNGEAVHGDFYVKPGRDSVLNEECEENDLECEIAAFYAMKNTNIQVNPREFVDERDTEVKHELKEDLIEPHNNTRDLLIENIPLTGDSEIDEEIIAFYAARTQIVCR
ncbi:hypothetical protein L9F63_023383 [Diploptera punctata]|uniref:Kinesin-like protein n=1 Tax=Diploptera punctata TaxID=6984 RepID=A0AAD7ZJA4_DIPPU|nr:hypothetical protein L9F63_023383 [Diploptera punctata]